MKPIITLCLLWNASQSLAAVAPEEVHAILDKHCATCHGEKGAGEGGFDYVLELDTLTQGTNPKVVAGKSESSRLFKRIIKKEMPPEDAQDELSDHEIATIKQWIDEGAHAKEKKLPTAGLSEEEILSAIEKDLASLTPARQKNVRYLTFEAWEKSGVTAMVALIPDAANKAFNSLSWQPQPQKVRPVATSVIAVELELFGWSNVQWDIATDEYPYSGSYQSTALTRIRKATGTSLPVVRGDWLIRESTRPPKYHFLLQLPENDRALELALRSRGARLDVVNDILTENVSRSGFNRSGVALNKNRLLERHEFEYNLKGNIKKTAYFWRSYDVKVTTGRGNLFAFPLTILDNPDFAFAFDGGEFIFSLPNGFQAYYLANSRGNRIDEGPIDLVSGTKLRPVITNGISCMDCHSRGLIVKDDEIRTHALASDFPEEVKAKISALYPETSDMHRLFETDIEQHVSALRKIGIDDKKSDPVNAMVNIYESDLNPLQAASEIGLPLADFLSAVKKSGIPQARLGGVSGNAAISRVDWEEQYAKLRTFLYQKKLN